MLNSKLNLVVAISLAIGVTGCSTLKKPTTTPTGNEQTQTQSQAEKDKQAAEAQAAALAEQERLKAEALANAAKNQGKNVNGQNADDGSSDQDANSSNQADLLSNLMVHFDYDSSDLSSDDLKTLQAHAAYLRQNSQAKVLLSGHADERGTREYNMALGERRANAVQAFLSSNGARNSQLDTVSYGKEKPINDGHDEAAWAENRRVEITYKAGSPR